MADESELQKILHLSQDDMKVLNTAGEVVGLISGISGYVGAAKGLLTALGILDADDPLKSAVDEIKNAFDYSLSTEDTSLKMILVADKVDEARGAYALLRDHAPEHASGPTVPGSLWDEDRGIVDRDSNDAVVSLTNEAYWQRPFLGQQYSDPAFGFWEAMYGESMTPEVIGGAVFDYRLTLPAFLEVIILRLIIIAAINDNWRPATGVADTPISKATDRLEKVVTKIRAGIREMLPPTPDQLQLVPPPPDPRPTSLAPTARHSWWRTYSSLFGAVEVYSTYHAVDRWPDDEWPSPTVWPSQVTAYEQQLKEHDYYDSFRIRHLVRTMARWKQVYINIGLSQAVSVLAQLKALTGQPADPAGPQPDPGHMRNGDWSLMELVQRLQAYVQTDGTHLALVSESKTISLRGVLAKLQESGLGKANPASMRAALPLLQPAT